MKSHKQMKDMKQAKQTHLFPAFLKLAGRRCLVIGAGKIGEEKIGGLLEAGAKIEVVAPRATDLVQAWARERRIRWHAREFRMSDLSGIFVIVAATSSPRLHARIYKEARRRGILCNVVDDPPHCDFYYGAVVRRGSLQIAISTAGHSPSLAQRLKKEIDAQFGSAYETWIAELGRKREKLFEKAMDSERRKKILHNLASQPSWKQFLRRENRKLQARKHNKNSKKLHSTT